MRSEKEVYDIVLNFAKADERIRMVTLEGSWPPCPPIQRGGGGTVKAGRQPIHFSLDGFLPSCYFSRSVATHLVTVSRALGLFVP